MTKAYTVIQGDCLHWLRQFPSGLFNCCVTSPPYFGLRDYGVEGQIGLEDSPEAFVSRLVEVFREVKRVLRDDGTLWLNLGDSYATTHHGVQGDKHGDSFVYAKERLAGQGKKERKNKSIPEGLKNKDLIGIPWMVAFALRADGWYLRQDIIWHKPNPMPESVTDRCTKSHEYIFLLTKSPKYFFDHESVKEDAKWERWGNQTVKKPQQGTAKWIGNKSKAELQALGKRNRRSVWTVTTKPYRGAHFATFPPDLIRPCILAGCPQGGTVLDPFGGSGTTAQVAVENGRQAVLLELNPEYAKLIHQRMEGL